MSNPFIVTSFYTTGTGYEQEAKDRLIPSLERFGIPYDIVGIASKGPWERNIYEKAQVILDAMERVGWGVNVVWLDADAEVVSYPKLFGELMCDFAFHAREPAFNLSSGTMFFANRHAGRALVEHWRNALQKAVGAKSRQTEQQILQNGVIPFHDSLKLQHLPLSYSTIFDGPQPDEPVVIRHHQASRRLKKTVAKAPKSA